MSIKMPPPPNTAPQGSRVWKEWYTKLQAILADTAGLAWALVDKTGSALSDLAIRPHSALTTILGTGAFHVSSTEATTVTSLNTRGIIDLKSKSGAPNSTDIPASQWAIYKDTSSGVVKLWVNDAGTLKSVTLT